MSVVTLTFSPSDNEIMAGVPEYVEIESNVPATIFYTTDGSVPSIDSFVYVSAVQVAADGRNSFTLSAFAIDYDGYESSVLTQTFAADQTEITISRLVGGEGLIIDEYANQTNRVDGFDADGEAIRFIDLPVDQVDIIHSDRGLYGIAEGTKVEVNFIDPEDSPSRLDDQTSYYSTPEKAALFDPYAKVIAIDNRIDNEVKIIPRPHGSLNNIYREFYGFRARHLGAACISGGFVRRLYDHNTNTMVGYYYDNNSNQWIKNTQTIPSIPTQVGPVFTMPLVFRWISRGRQQSANS